MCVFLFFPSTKTVTLTNFGNVNIGLQSASSDCARTPTTSTPEPPETPKTKSKCCPHFSPAGPALARSPSLSHCSELFMVSPGTRFRLSGDICHVRLLSSFFCLVHLWRMLFLSSHWSPLGLCRGDVRPRHPCSAEWTGQPVGFTPKQLDTARHGQHPRE